MPIAANLQPFVDISVIFFSGQGANGPRDQRPRES